MIFRLDRYLVDRFDAACVWLQRRGWLLTAIRVYITASVLVTNVALGVHQRNLFVILGCGTIWTVLLMAGLRMHKSDGDYAEVVRKTERLNAVVLMMREERGVVLMRIVSVGACCVIMPGMLLPILVHQGAYLHVALEVAGAVAFGLYMYMYTAFFMGPGNFGRQAKKAPSGDVATQRSQG